MRCVTMADGKAVIGEKCLSCGVCVGKCPFGAVPAEGKTLCQIYVGGTWGKTTRIGTPLKRMVPVEEVGDIVESAMLWYRENGYVKMDGNGYITLAKPGLDIATKIYERHVLITKVLEDLGITATIRASRGEDIMAACGMLAGKDKENSQTKE